MNNLTEEEERIMNIFGPDTLLPAQYFETLKRQSLPEGEKALMLAVLENTIGCFQKYLFAADAKGKNEFRDAEEWIMSDGDDWFFSFSNICEVLELTPDYLRQGLLRWKEARKAGEISRIKHDRRYKSGGGRRKMK